MLPVLFLEEVGKEYSLRPERLAGMLEKAIQIVSYPVPLCSAHLTTAGNLPNTRFVIHAVSVSLSERYGLDCDPETIFKSAWNVLDLANVHKLRSVAFPALGSGLYEVPVDESFGAIASATTKFFKENPTTTLGAITLVAMEPLLKAPSLMAEIVMDQIARNMRPSRESMIDTTFPITTPVYSN